MYLHLGSNAIVFTKDIIGIFDMDKTTVSARTRNFLAAKEKEGTIVVLGDGLPQSFVVTKEKVFLSPISSKTLEKRKDITQEIL